MSLEYRPEDPAFLADPFPALRRLQDEDPCHWSPRLKAWIVTRYDDVRRILLDAHVSSDRVRPFFASLPPPEAQRIADITRYLSLWMVFRDPPEHTRLRRLTSRVFHVKSMQGMRPRVESIARWLLERIGEREEIDFIADFAGPLPALVIMDMLGVPREELARVKRLSDDMALFIGSSRMSPEKYDIAQSATHEMAGLFRSMIAGRRAEPRGDLLSELVHLEDEGDRLSEDELVATCVLLLFAGHETTTNHLANGLLGLMRFPEAMRRLRDDPGLAPAAVEELLRFDGPNSAQGRIVRVPQALHGKRLGPGERLFVLLNAANRDPRVYDDPDRVRIGRDGPPHLAFGFGMHICLGFPLARLEGQIALPAVLARWPVIEPAQPRYDWLNSMVFRGMPSMPVRVRR
jgi:cytochrome P450